MVSKKKACTGGPPSKPCPFTPFFKIWIVGGEERQQLVCGRHYRSVSVDLLKRGSYLGVREV